MTMQIHTINTDISLEDQIITNISWSLNISSQRLKYYTHFVDDLHLDDVDMMLLIASLESHLNLYLSREEVDGIETMGDLNKCFQQQLAVAA